METSKKFQVVGIEREIRDIMDELNVALAFLSEAHETSDKDYQRQLIKYVQIVHQAVLRLLPSLPLCGLDQTRVTVRLLQIRVGLKSHGISVSWRLERPEMTVWQRKGPGKEGYLN